MTAAIHDAVAIRAYHIWEGEGRPDGRHEHHWFAAEAVEALALAPVQAPAVEAVVTAAPVAVEAAPAPAPAKKAAAAKKTSAATEKPAASKKAAPVKAATPKAPAETVVAAAALKAPRAARGTAKGSRTAH